MFQSASYAVFTDQSTQSYCTVFSAANLALAGFLQTNALGENLPSRYLNMFNLRLCNAATIWYFILKFGHLHLCGKGYNYFSPHCCKCNSFGGIAAIICANACLGPHSDSVYSGSEHRQFNSPRLVKREAGFPSRRRALIGLYQLWRVNDSPHYRELVGHGHFICKVSEPSLWEQKTYAHFKIISKPNMSYCSADW